MKLLAFVLFTSLVPASVNAGILVSRFGEVEFSLDSGPGHVTNPVVSADGREVAFELLQDGAQEVYSAKVSTGDAFPPAIREARQAVSSKAKGDLFSLEKSDERPVSEGPSWGPAKRRGNLLAMAATRMDISRGKGNVNFDLYVSARGKRNFITQSPANDGQPSFNPAGNLLAFVSGRTGQGDIYVYDFYSDNPMTRLTFFEAGAEMFPSWSLKGHKLVYTSHAQSSDHVYVIENVVGLISKTDEREREMVARKYSRDLTPDWTATAFAPSFSPDGSMVAFYSRPRNGGRASLHIVDLDNGAIRQLFEGCIPHSRSGPSWAPDSAGIFVVSEDRKLLDPIMWVPVAEGAEPERLELPTQLNRDIFVTPYPGGARLWFAASGTDSQANEKRWKRLYVADISTN